MHNYHSDINIKVFDASIQKLASAFSCGNLYIDSFLKSRQALDHSFGKTYVWLDSFDSEIIGFYNISAGSVDYIDTEDRYKMGGAVHINEFALKESYQGVSTSAGINISDILLEDCLQRIMNIRENHIGCAFVTLQSTEEGYNLYKRNDFEDIEEDMELSRLQSVEEQCKPMYLVLELV